MFVICCVFYGSYVVTACVACSVALSGDVVFRPVRTRKKRGVLLSSRLPRASQSPPIVENNAVHARYANVLRTLRRTERIYISRGHLLLAYRLLVECCEDSGKSHTTSINALLCSQTRLFVYKPMFTTAKVVIFSE